MLTINQVIEKHPYLKKRWIMERAKEGLIPYSRPHYRLYMFDEDEFEKALKHINRNPSSDFDNQLAREHFNKKRKQ